MYQNGFQISNKEYNVLSSFKFVLRFHKSHFNLTDAINSCK